ncbi:hypothetical protein G9A89_001631 [Geosiphon pyriformis]|nr:hypothetical protein G9A89_001631 [Geosiphon pyriformis]
MVIKGLSGVIGYNIKVTEGDLTPTPNFGTQEYGYIYQATSSSMNGLITAVMNDTALQFFLDPNAKKIYIRAPASCYIQRPQIVAAAECDIDFTWSISTMLCLAVANPNKRPIQFTLKLSFDSKTDNNNTEETNDQITKNGPTSTIFSSSTPVNTFINSITTESMFPTPQPSSGFNVTSDGSQTFQINERMDLLAISVMIFTAFLFF